MDGNEGMAGRKAKPDRRPYGGQHELLELSSSGILCIKVYGRLEGHLRCEAGLLGQKRQGVSRVGSARLFHRIKFKRIPSHPRPLVYIFCAKDIFNDGAVKLV